MPERTPTSLSDPLHFSKAPALSSQEDEALVRTIKELADIKYALDEAAIVAITDPQGKIIYVNDYFCELSQYSRQELLGQDHRIINSGYHPSEFFQKMWATIGHGDVWKAEVKNRAKDGSYYWVDTTIVPFIDDATGKPYQYVAIRKDITYLKRIEGELRLLNEELEKRVTERTKELQESNRELSEALIQLQDSERIRETFVSALTHDLRTPLVAAQRALELFHSQKELLSPRLEPVVDRLIHNNDDLLEMVNKLLEVYQYEAGKIRLIREPVNLHTLTERVLENLRHIANTHGTQLINEIPPNCPMLKADKHQLQRVLTNLVGNAIEHMIKGENGEVKVSIKELNADELEICISDNGPGIPADILPFLFERYFAQQTKKKIGSGLGLSICKMITKLHGGNIRVESAPGEGARFYMKLPGIIKDPNECPTEN